MNNYPMQGQPTQQTAPPAIGQGAAAGQGAATGMTTNGMQLSPETIQAIMNLQQNQADQAKVQKQMKMADALRSQSQSGVQSSSKINTPNWAQALANVYAGYKGKQTEQEAAAKQDALTAERMQSLRKYFDEATKPGGGSGGGSSYRSTGGDGGTYGGYDGFA